MGIAHRLIQGQVMHKRTLPKVNAFSYGIYYLALNLDALNNMPLAYNRFAAMSFYDKDHGARDGSDLKIWAKKILDDFDLHKADGEIVLVCMPRIFGYVFNPVSFWVCYDASGDIRAILSEVHNTFGERHTYICAHDDQRPITDTDIMAADKDFHVSPFLERTGHYRFRFKASDRSFGAWIDYYNNEENKQLITSLLGTFSPMMKKDLRHVFWRYPLVPMKAILLIHWQALKIITKRIPYISKPQQNEKTITITRINLDK